MDETRIDVNTATESSPAPAVTETASAPVNPTLNDESAYAQAILDKHVETEAQPAPAPEATETVEGEQKPVEQKDVKANEAPDVKVKPHEEAIPYQRFQEVNTQLSQLRERVEQRETFKRSHGITDADEQAALEFLRMVRTDPAAAYATLTPLVDQLKPFVGEKLPADLQAEVDEGILPVTRAKEIAKHRAQGEFAKTSQADQAQRSMKKAQDDIVAEVNKWTVVKQASDPDLKPGSQRWQLVEASWLSGYQSFVAQNRRVPTPQEAVTLADKAYETVVSYATSLAPKAPQKKVLTSTNASTTATAKAKGPLSATQEALAKHGIELDPASLAAA